MQALLATCGAWHLRETAGALFHRGALAGLWITDANARQLPPEKYRRCWPFHLAMKPFYRWAPQILAEQTFYAMYPLWRTWVRRQRLPECQVVHAVMGFAGDLFDRVDASVLKVVDCPNSHPVTYYGFWQRECDLWCPGERPPVPRSFLSRANRELDRADLIVVQSVFCKESMVLNGIPAEKVLVNPMGVDTSIFKPRPGPPAKPRFVTVATICLRKGHQYLFRAFQRVKQQLPEAELICVGSYKSDFREERPRWEGTFTHIPHLNHAELAKLLATCTAFVFPSQEEGIARAQIEALACGLPLIGTHVGGATTLVEDGVEGFIVDGRNPEAIAHAMLKLASNSTLNLQVGQAAYKKGAQNNTWQHYGDRLLDEYRKRLEQTQ